MTEFPGGEAGGYGFDVGRFITDHPDHIIKIGAEGFGYDAQHRGESGRGTGPHHSALTLDELAAKLAADPQAAP